MKDETETSFVRGGFHDVTDFTDVDPFWIEGEHTTSGIDVSECFLEDGGMG